MSNKAHKFGLKFQYIVQEKKLFMLYNHQKNEAESAKNLIHACICIIYQCSYSKV